MSRHMLEEQNKERDLAGIIKIIDNILALRRADVDEQHELLFTSTIPDDAEHPASTPIYWISKWVDYSDKYGNGALIILRLIQMAKQCQMHQHTESATCFAITVSAYYTMIRRA